MNDNDKLSLAIEALCNIKNTSNTKIICVYHGGNFGKDEPNACNCAISARGYEEYASENLRLSEASLGAAFEVLPPE